MGAKIIPYLFLYLSLPFILPQMGAACEIPVGWLAE